MTKHIKSPRLRFMEEVFNSVSHAIGLGLSIAGLVLLIVFAVIDGNVWKIVSFTIFGSSLVILYASSMLYHSTKNRIKYIFNKMDHAAIYILIAGTYTPFMLVTLRGGWGWSIFGVIWALAIAGVIMKFWFFNPKYRTISALLYLFMGWLVIIAIKPLIDSLDAGGLYFLMAGGLCYSFGIVFYLVKRIPFGHGIWHLFVIGGSICHFFSVLLYV
ncbi:MAG: hemolysin III family protein [Bacteroidales bacterium]|nr:hemolysin III family protein [Bacteroidales bacterium]